MNFGTVAILGPGLIGGSLALALAELNLTNRIIIYSRSKSSWEEIRAAVPTIELTTEPAEAVKDADIVVLCLPIETMFKFVCPIAHLFKPSALVTDVGSVKSSVDRDLAPLFAPNAKWIGSHPMTGSEKSGFNAAHADLFKGATVVITPTDKTSLVAENRAREFWEALGARVYCLDPESHDIAVAEISHIPHLLAAFLVAKATEEGRAIAGGGFRDTTRVASGSPELWTEIIWANRRAIETHLRVWKEVHLTTMVEILKSEDEAKSKQALFKILEDAQITRNKMTLDNPLFKKRP